MTNRTYKTIRCADCGGEAKAPNSRTLYCAFCRLARGVAWQDGRTDRCVCGREFIAWNGRRSSRYCGQCFIEYAPAGGRESIEGECRLCKTTGRLHSEHLHVCYPCLSNPANYKIVKRGVAGAYADLTTAH